MFSARAVFLQTSWSRFDESRGGTKRDGRRFVAVVQPQIGWHLGIPVKVSGYSNLIGDSAVYITRVNESLAPSFHPTYQPSSLHKLIALKLGSEGLLIAFQAEMDDDAGDAAIGRWPTSPKSS